MNKNPTAEFPNMPNIQKLLNTKGAGLVEYAVLVGLISVVSIGVVLQTGG